MKICFHVQIQCGETADGEGGEARDQPPSESEVPSKDTEEEREVEEDERKEGAEESVPPLEKGQSSYIGAHIMGTGTHNLLTVLYSI